MRTAVSAPRTGAPTEGTCAGPRQAWPSNTTATQPTRGLSASQTIPVGRNALAERGITVVGVTWQQACSFEDLDRVARIVARILGHRMRERRPDQLERRMALHGQLFLQR